MAETPIGKRVRIVGDHPHKGAVGTVAAERWIGGGPMLRVTLDYGDYPGQECYASPVDLRPLPRDEDPDV